MSSATAARILRDMELPVNFCPLPFVAAECKTDGAASVCCVHQGSLPNFNFADNTIIKFKAFNGQLLNAEFDADEEALFYIKSVCEA